MKRNKITAEVHSQNLVTTKVKLCAWNLSTSCNASFPTKRDSQFVIFDGVPLDDACFEDRPTLKVKVGSKD